MLIYFGTLAFSKGLGSQMYSIIPEISYYSESAYEYNQFHNLLGCHFVVNFNTYTQDYHKNLIIIKIFRRLVTE